MRSELDRMWKEAVVALFDALSRHYPGRTEGNHKKKLSQDSRSSGPDLSLRPPKYEPGVLTTQPRFCVTLACISEQYR
jgi:hypothetical protein